MTQKPNRRNLCIRYIKINHQVRPGQNELAILNLNYHTVKIMTTDLRLRKSTCGRTFFPIQPKCGRSASRHQSFFLLQNEQISLHTKLGVLPVILDHTKYKNMATRYGIFMINTTVYQRNVTIICESITETKYAKDKLRCRSTHIADIRSLR